MGVGPMLHRSYAVRITGSSMTPAALVNLVAERLNQASPEMTVFRKTRGTASALRLGDEFLVRMPAYGDGPVRVVRRDPAAFRLATLDGHLAGWQPGCYCQRSGSVARAWADCPAASTSIQAVAQLAAAPPSGASSSRGRLPRSSGGRWRVACPPAAVADPYPQREIRFHVRRPVKASRRHAAGMPVQGGAAVEIVQARIASLIPSSSGSAQGLLRLVAAVVREQAEPRSGQLPGGPGGDAVAADVQARAQRGELAGDQVKRGQDAARLQRR
jgi:hypothetical protein